MKGIGQEIVSQGINRKFGVGHQKIMIVNAWARSPQNAKIYNSVLVNENGEEAKQASLVWGSNRKITGLGK